MPCDIKLKNIEKLDWEIRIGIPFLHFILVYICFYKLFSKIVSYCQDVRQRNIDECVYSDLILLIL